MEHVFILEHIYEIEENEEVKFIGVFSTELNAQKVINELITKKGFKKYPQKCFVISKLKIDEFEWKEGFISWEELNSTKQ